MPGKIKASAHRFFSFFETEKPTYPLLFFRVGLGIICIVKFFVIRVAFLTLFGQYGLTQWAISKLVSFSFLPHIGDFALFLNKHFSISVNGATELLLQIFFLFSIFLLLGFLTRLSTLICFILHLAFLNTGYTFMYGVDSFTQIALFYALFFPLNITYSIDCFIGISKFKKSSVLAGIFIRVVQFQLCIVYLSASIEKLRGKQWFNGEAMWRSLMVPIFKHYDFSWMAQFPFIPLVLGYSILIIEFGYTFFMWRKNIRVAWFFLVLSMHFGIGLFMGMWCFAFTMIFLSMFAFGDDVMQDILSYFKKIPSTQISVFELAQSELV